VCQRGELRTSLKRFWGTRVNSGTVSRLNQEIYRRRGEGGGDRN